MGILVGILWAFLMMDSMTVSLFSRSLALIAFALFSEKVRKKWEKASLRVYVSLTTEAFVKMVGTVIKNILRKYAKTETVLENHVSNDTQKAASSSLRLYTVNLLNFVVIIMKEKIPMLGFS